MKKENQVVSNVQYQVRVSSSAGKETPGEVRVQHWTHQERMKRAIKVFFLCWGLAAVAVLIPLLHFILVPSLVIAGPISAYMTLQQESVVLGGESRCPECGADLVIVRAPEKWPLSDLCAKC